jgi:hypothetical protein
VPVSGGILPPEQFSVEAPGRSNFVLRGLGFTVEMKGEAVAEPAEAKDWTTKEASLIVVDDFVLRASVRDADADWFEVASADHTEVGHGGIDDTRVFPQWADVPRARR